MSVRRLKIGIRTAAERNKGLRDAMRHAANGDRVRREPALYFENIDDLRRVLTEKRLELMVVIARERPASVHELAGIVGRDYKNVSTDVALLERLGLVSLATSPGNGRDRKPTVPYDEIHVTINLRRHQEVRSA
jgi:predicted transcriptional regulator